MILARKALPWLALVALPVAAQQPVAAPAGVAPPFADTLVRVWRVDRFASPRVVSGRVLAITAESLVIHSSQRGTAIALPLDSVSRFEFSTRRESRERNTLLGAGLGAVIGVPTVGAVIFVLGSMADGPTSRTRLYATSGVVGALVGAGTGAIIGSIFPGRRIWQPVRLELRR